MDLIYLFSSIYFKMNLLDLVYQFIIMVINEVLFNLNILLYFFIVIGNYDCLFIFVLCLIIGLSFNELEFISNVLFIRRIFLDFSYLDHLLLWCNQALEISSISKLSSIHQYRLIWLKDKEYEVKNRYLRKSIRI